MTIASTTHIDENERRENSQRYRDLEKKTQRHRLLVKDVTRILIEKKDFLNDAVPEVARLLAQNLHAECVCIFFRRKVTKDLCRDALAFNERWPQDRERFDWDSIYQRDSETPTLLRETYNKGQTINYGPEEIRGEQLDPYRQIIEQFKGCLNSRRFEHLIIVPIYIFNNRQLGAIRVLNHLDGTRSCDISNRPFTNEQDVALVSSIGDVLALAYSNYRKSKKLDALQELGRIIVRETDPAKAVKLCLDKLASEETGFPLAIWREYRNESASVVKDYSHVRKPLEADALSGKGEPGSLVAVPTLMDFSTEEFRSRPWAKGHELGAAYLLPIQYSARKHMLEVYADDNEEFDQQSMTLIDIIADLLQGTLARIESAIELDRIQFDYAATGIIGKSLREIIKEACNVAAFDSTVLILGERGTGKQKFADLIHKHSARSNIPIVIVNCAAFTDALLESELFGHEPHSFTGAGPQTKKGKFESANEGTIFLDEIGNLSPAAQQKVLHVLESKPFFRVGGTESVTVNVRVLAATNEDLAVAIQEKRFRADLFDRLNVYNLRLPPLRERSVDIPELAIWCLAEKARHLKKSIQTIDDDAMVLLVRHRWEGNVRELLNAIESAIVKASGDAVSVKDLPDHIQNAKHSTPGVNPANAGTGTSIANQGLGKTIRELETEYEARKKELIEKALQAGGNDTAAARILGIPRTSLQTAKRQLGISKSLGK